MELSDKEITQFNELYEQACKKMEGLILLDGYAPKKLGFLEKIRAKKAISLFSQALQLYPTHFASLFFIGKIYQRMEKYNMALEFIEKALEFEHSNHSIAQEASLVAMSLNEVEKAVSYSAEAVRRAPNHAPILGNHAMNLLIAGKDSEALETIEKALSIEPEDKINQRIHCKILAVISGEEDRPTYEIIK